MIETRNYSFHAVEFENHHVDAEFSERMVESLDRIARLPNVWCQGATNDPHDARDIGDIDSQGAASRRRTPDPGGAQGTARVLIVDDSAPDAAMMTRYLESIDDIAITSASDTRRAQELLRNERFDVILLDYRMPGLTGLNLLEVIRRRDPDVGVIMVTAFSDEKVTLKAIRRRVDDYLRKEDLTREILTEAVESLLPLVRRRRSATIDFITGLFCGRALIERIMDVVDRLESRGEDFSLLLVDLVQFSQVNERFGRATGDRVLRRIGRVLQDALRPGDSAARDRADEFWIIAPGTDANDALALAQRLRESIRALEFDYGDGAFTVDCVIGGAHFKDRCPDTVEATIEYTHEALQRARTASTASIEVVRY